MAPSSASFSNDVMLLRDFFYLLPRESLEMHRYSQEYRALLCFTTRYSLPLAFLSRFVQSLGHSIPRDHVSLRAIDNQSWFNHHGVWTHGARTCQSFRQCKVLSLGMLDNVKNVGSLNLS